MSFKRELLPRAWSRDEKLTGDMNGIGFIFSGPVNYDANIEDTLVAASIEGIIGRQGRIMSLLTDWITVHSSKINVDRLTTILSALDPKDMRSVQIYWCATAQRLSRDSRFQRLRNLYHGPRVDYLAMLENEKNEENLGTNLLIKKNGEDVRFIGTCIRVPSLVLRHRLRDVMAPDRLAKHHSGYKFRVMFGPTYRADLWALLKKHRNLSISELARRAYCSYNTAKMVKDDFDLINRQSPDKNIA
jgi:hypothetical protein